MSSSPTDDARWSRAVDRCRRWASRVAEGTILEWRKQPGDWVEADETIADVTTDKVDVEIPSPASGRLARILAEPGDTVAVGDADRRDRRRRDGRARRIRDESPPGRATRPRSAATDGARPDRSGFFSPVVRRIADKHGIDLEQVEGTGIGGRVRKKDVLAYVEARRQRATRSASAVLHTESPYRPEPTRRRARSRAARGGRVAPSGERREPMTPMRQAIARHMVEQPPHGGALHDDRRGRHVARRGAARRAQARRWRSAASPSPISPSSPRRRSRRSSSTRPQRLGRRRRDRPPRRRQPRDRGRPRRRADRAGDPPRPSGSASRAWPRRSPTSPSARARSGSSPTRSTAARSRSPTRGSSGPCSRRRSSTSRRWRSSTSRRSSSGRWWSTDEAAAIRSRSGR